MVAFVLRWFWRLFWQGRVRAWPPRSGIPSDWVEQRYAQLLGLHACDSKHHCTTTPANIHVLVSTRVMSRSNIPRLPKTGKEPCMQIILPNTTKSLQHLQHPL